jgi:hypothetical protein
MSLGYVNVPSALIMAAVTTATAPFGARLAHRLPRNTLRAALRGLPGLTAGSDRMGDLRLAARAAVQGFRISELWLASNRERRPR